MSEDLAFAGAARQAEMVRAGEVSPTELLELHLERIERLDPQLNAFRTVRAERARAEARRVEERLGAGEEMPLAGVPVAIKDTDDVEGELTTHGTAAFDGIAAADGEMTRRLRAAGAVVAGKTNLPELAICGFTESKTFGVTRNPWDVSRSPGGSSGGSAAAVAAGLIPLASASDGAGSIRIPAAFNGVFGLKPQRGRISLSPAREHWHGLSVLGCEARSVGDAALFLDVTHGPVPGDPPAPPPPSQPFRECAESKPARLRIAVSTKPVRALAPPRVTDEVKAAVHDVAGLLCSLGHDVRERDPDYGLSLPNNFTPRYLRGILEEVEKADHPERLEDRTRGFARMGSLIADFALRRARRGEASDARRVLSIFDECDVLLTPVTGELPIEVERWKDAGALRTLIGMSRTYPFCAAWNHLGNPAASVPAGMSSGGLPLAVQLVGRPNDEATLISLAAEIEAERPWAERRPPFS